MENLTKAKIKPTLSKNLIILAIIIILFAVNMKILDIGLTPLAVVVFGVSIVFMIFVMKYKADAK